MKYKVVAPARQRTAQRKHLSSQGFMQCSPVSVSTFVDKDQGAEIFDGAFTRISMVLFAVFQKMATAL
jgi:hypothetical protein